MQKSINHADRIATLALSIAVIIAYLMEFISVPFAFTLLIISILVLIIELINTLAAAEITRGSMVFQIEFLFIKRDAQKLYHVL